jgi:hypothetical protein
MKLKLQFFNVSKSHLMLNVSRIYAHKITNLGTMFLRDPSKQATRLPEVAEHPFWGISNFKEEMVEGIGWTPK